MGVQLSSETLEQRAQVLKSDAAWRDNRLRTQAQERRTNKSQMCTGLF
jgi:hypothetical protein